MEEYIRSLQNFVEELLRKGNETKSLSVLAKCNCSEMSRILGLKVLKDLKGSKPFILNGDVTVTGLSKNNSHDILGFYDSDKKCYILIDPTIWQFFPKKESIFLDEFKNIEELITFAENFYKGNWQISEYLNATMEKELPELERIIRLNCDEADK